MEKAQWDYIQDRLKIYQVLDGYLTVDGYKVALQIVREPKNFLVHKIMVYVNGEFRASCVVPKTPEDQEIAKRFYKKSARALLSFEKLRKCGYTKKQALLQHKTNLKTFYMPTWSNFNDLRRHYEKNNSSISFVKYGSDGGTSVTQD